MLLLTINTDIEHFLMSYLRIFFMFDENKTNKWQTHSIYGNSVSLLIIVLNTKYMYMLP